MRRRRTHKYMQRLKETKGTRRMGIAVGSETGRALGPEAILRIEPTRRRASTATQHDEKIK